eukprot:SAG31_NODE_2968_length_4839_cov_2.825738_3_plen_87_part_00
MLLLGGDGTRNGVVVQVEGDAKSRTESGELSFGPDKAEAVDNRNALRWRSASAALSRQLRNSADSERSLVAKRSAVSCVRSATFLS